MACSSPALAISFDANGTLHQVSFNEFSGDQIRNFVDAASLATTATGALSQTGETRVARRLWTVAAYCDVQTVYDLEALYVAWDTTRAQGEVAVISISDQTRMPTGSAALTAQGIFSASPQISQGLNGSALYLVSFALLEV